MIEWQGIGQKLANHLKLANEDCIHPQQWVGKVRGTCPTTLHQESEGTCSPTLHQVLGVGGGGE